MTLELRQVDAPPLRGIDLELAAGLHVVLGAEADGSRELVEIVSGVRRPQRGTVRVLGRDPFRTPAVRRRIASLLAEEQLPHAATVEQLVGHALALHAQPASDALRALSDAGIEAWRTRRPSSLDAHERRTVALAIALAQAPALLVAHEPLARVAAVERGRVIERLNALAAKDTCVLCTTSSPRDALELTDAVWLLEAGRLTRRPSPARRELVPGHAAEFLVHAEDARSLGRRLSEDPAVKAVEWDDERTPGQLRVRGDDAAASARAIVRAAAAGAHTLTRLTLVPPSLSSVRAATHALAQAAYEHAYRTAQHYYGVPPPAPGPSHGPPSPPADLPTPTNPSEAKS